MHYAGDMYFFPAAAMNKELTSEFRKAGNFSKHLSLLQNQTGSLKKIPISFICLAASDTN